MVLTEKENKILGHLRSLSERSQVNYSSTDDLSDEEIVSIYEKMDAVIEEERTVRRSLGFFDEVYVSELAHVKRVLSEEIIKRGLNMI